MNKEVEKLHQVWEKSQQTTNHVTLLPQINFKEIVGSIISTGHFYYYVIDFFDMSLSNVSPSIIDMHGLDPRTATFDDILNTIHPEDIDFVARAEQTAIDFVYEKLGEEKILNYKVNYSFKSRMKDGKYALLNHQALILTVDENGKFGKSLNIHTRIDHLTKTNNNQISLIGLNGFPSFMNIEVFKELNSPMEFSKRELEVLKLISEGYSNSEIA